MGTRAVRIVAGLLVVGALLGAPGSVPTSTADSTDQQAASVDQQIAALKQSLDGASSDLVNAVVALKQSQLALGPARAALAAAQATEAVAVAHDQEVGAQLQFAQAQLGQAEQDLTARQSAEDRSRSALGEIARATYVGDELSGLSVALSATTPEEFDERLAIAQAALRAQGSTIDRLAVAEADLRARAFELNAVRAQVVVLKQESAAVVAARNAATQKAAAAQAHVQHLVATETAQVGALQNQIVAEKKRLADLQVVQAKLQAYLAARAAADAAAAERQHGSGWVPPASSGFLSYPAPGPITSGFGMRFHPILHIWRMHTGVDWGVACGTPVHAAADGTVISAGWAGGYGNRIVIDHGEVSGGDLATTYNHLSQILISSGPVTRGEVIALSGTTGLSTGCHLHFETLVNGRYVDPLNFL